MCTGHQLTFLLREVTCSSCNIGIRALPCKVRSGLIILILKIIIILIQSLTLLFVFGGGKFDT